MTIIDEVLDIFHRTGPEYAGGLSNHGPMAAEALITMGRSDMVLSWAENYKRRLQDPPEADDPISEPHWQEALGDFQRVGDWLVFFDRQLADAPWPVVLNKWASRLAPGIVAAAFHGLIRTGHAVRSLEAGQTPQRRRELAEGLAYWAAHYGLLPGAPSNDTGNLLPSQAIRLVETAPEEKRRAIKMISDGLRWLEDVPSFADAINLVDTSGDAASFLSDLTETLARVYLANGRDLLSVLIFIHAVTGPSALRVLLPHLSSEAIQAVLRYGWQATAALYAAFGQTANVGSFEPWDESREDLIDRAAANGDEHVIKFTEVCLREVDANPTEVYLAAAGHAMTYLRTH